jgi:hypothetical protein
MRAQATEYKTKYIKALNAYNLLKKRADDYLAMAQKYGDEAKRLREIADQLRSKAARMQAHMLRAQNALTTEVHRIEHYSTLANQFRGEWQSSDLGDWMAGYHGALREIFSQLIMDTILPVVPDPVPDPSSHESRATHMEAIATENLDAAEGILKLLIMSYQESRYYASLSDADDAYQQIVDDSGYAYHYKLLQTDSHGRVTSYIAGNGLINDSRFDDSGAMVRSRTGYDDTTLLRDLTYEYDELYNLNKREDTFLGVTSTYQYDTLNRIEHAHFDYAKIRVRR